MRSPEVWDTSRCRAHNTDSRMATTFQKNQRDREEVGLRPGRFWVPAWIARVSGDMVDGRMSPTWRVIAHAMGRRNRRNSARAGQACAWARRQPQRAARALGVIVWRVLVRGWRGLAAAGVLLGHRMCGALSEQGKGSRKSPAQEHHAQPSEHHDHSRSLLHVMYTTEVLPIVKTKNVLDY